jgi:hypothetical protein
MAVPRRMDSRLTATAEDGPGKVNAFPGPYTSMSCNL